MCPDNLGLVTFCHRILGVTTYSYRQTHEVHIYIWLYTHLHERHQLPVSWSHLAFLLLFPMSYDVGLHHTAGAKDKTKHDLVWQLVSGAALIHGNPTVSRELGRGAAMGKRGGAQRGKQRQEKVKERNRRWETSSAIYTLAAILNSIQESNGKPAAQITHQPASYRKGTSRGSMR